MATEDDLSCFVPGDTGQREDRIATRSHFEHDSRRRSLQIDRHFAVVALTAHLEQQLVPYKVQRNFIVLA